MTRQKKGLIGALKGLLKKKMTPEQAPDELRAALHDLERQLRELDYDLRTRMKERDRIIQRGKNAVLQGDTAERNAAAADLKAIKVEVGDLQRTRSQMSKQRVLLRVSLRRLERASSKGPGDVMERIGKIFNSGEVQTMLESARATEDDLERLVNRQFEIEFGELTERAEVEETEFIEEAELLEQLARAEARGDAAEAARLTAELTGEQGAKPTAEGQTE